QEQHEHLPALTGFVQATTLPHVESTLVAPTRHPMSLPRPPRPTCQTFSSDPAPTAEASDHSLLAKRPPLIGAEAGEAPQYRLRMLAHERRSSRRERRGGQAYWTADHCKPSARRAVDVVDHAAPRE